MIAVECASISACYVYQVWAIWDQLIVIQQQQMTFKQELDSIKRLLLREMDSQRNHEPRERSDIRLTDPGKSEESKSERRR